MPDKLTDSEIVKALDEAELFLRNRVMDGMSLKLNEYDIGTLRNISQLCAKAYDEVNRLQAENEDIKFLYENLKEEHLEIIKAIKHTKAESYTDFAESLKKDFDNPHIQKFGLDFVKFLKNIVDNRFKELVGDTDV
jgi:hypothetical protein